MIIEKTKDQILIKISPKVDVFRFSTHYGLFGIVEITSKSKANNQMQINWLMNLIKPGGRKIRIASFNEGHC